MKSKMAPKNDRCVVDVLLHWLALTGNGITVKVENWTRQANTRCDPGMHRKLTMQKLLGGEAVFITLFAVLMTTNREHARIEDEDA